MKLVKLVLMTCGLVVTSASAAEPPASPVTERTTFGSCAPCSMGAAGTIVIGWGCADLVNTFEGYEIGYSQSLASALSQHNWYCPSDCDHPGQFGTAFAFAYYFQLGGPSFAVANAYAADSIDQEGGTTGSTCAQADPLGPSFELYAAAALDSSSNLHCCDGAPWNASVFTGRSYAQAQINRVQRSVTRETVIVPFQGTSYAQTNFDGISRTYDALVVDGIPVASHALICGYGMTRGVGMTLTDPIAGEWSGSGAAEIAFVSESIEVRFAHGSFSDRLLDADEDGRFNASDLALLQSIAASDPNNPDYVSRFDINTNGIIDTEDVEFLQLPILLALDSGVFPDFNRDGVLTCSDLDAIDLRIGLNLEDADYDFTLDANLDGVIDGSDRFAAYQAVVPGDLNFDRVVDLADQAILFSCWGLPCGDLTGDGTTNNADLGVMYGNWGGTCQQP